MAREELSYVRKLILAPMVRVGTLPLRLLALDYGADIVYCEELIDWKLLRSIRVENEVLNTVDYVDKTDGTVFFRTCSREKGRIVLQMGTYDANRALTVAHLVENDVAAIDVNMGCPKEFSIKGGMGAALLTQPEKVRSILTALVKNVNMPVTCKIRILPELEKTLQLCKLIEGCGVSAIAVHARTRVERQQHANHNDVIRVIAKHVSIPVIANGFSKEIKHFGDLEAFREETGAASVMVARAAEWNCSIFRREGKLPLHDVIKAYLKYAVDYDNAFTNTKYCVQNMLRELQDTPHEKTFLETQTLEEICAIWGMDGYYRQVQAQLKCVRDKLAKAHPCPEPLLSSVKRQRLGDEEIIEMECPFIRGHYSDIDLPKSRLLLFSRKKGSKQPVYKTQQKDKHFHSVVNFDGRKYTSLVWEKNKRYAEQGAALVCLHFLGLVDGSDQHGTASKFSCTNRSLVHSVSLTSRKCLDDKIVTAKQELESKEGIKREHMEQSDNMKVNRETESDSDICKGVEVRNDHSEVTLSLSDSVPVQTMQHENK